MNRPLVIVFATVFMIILAGCSGGGVLNSASVSDTSVQLTESGEPILLFNYSVNEEQSAVVETPGGTTIAERRVSPDDSRSALSFPMHQSGTYTLALRSEGETVTSEKIEFEGPNPQITAIEPTWSKNSLQSIKVQIENRGDLPIPVEETVVEARGQVVEMTSYEWLSPEGTSTVNLSTGYQSSIQINEPGDVRGDVTIQTPNETLSGTFQESFEGPNIDIADVNDSWEGNSLETVNLRIENNGDMAVTVNSSINRAGEEITTARSQIIPAGGYSNAELTSLGSIFIADSSGTVSLEVIVDSKYGYESTTIEKEIQPAKVEPLNISPNWNGDVLESIQIEATNKGDLESEVPAIVKVDGEEVLEDTVRIDGDSTQTDTISPLTTDIGTFTKSGTVEVTVTLKGDTASGTVSATTEFADREGDLFNIEPRFTNDYGETTSTLSSVSFDIRNKGDLPIRYDEIEFEVNGVTASDEPYFDQEVEPGESETEHTYPSLTVEEGTHELIIRLLYRGNTIVEETTTVST